MGDNIERHFVDEFKDWVSNMRELLERLSASFIKEMRSNKSLKPNRDADNAPPLMLFTRDQPTRETSRPVGNPSDDAGTARVLCCVCIKAI